MKAKFFALVALVLGLASCQNDFDGVKQNAKGEVNFELSVGAPDLGTTRAGEDGADTQNAMDSAFGAIDYLQGAATGDYRQDWGDVDLRYTLEVYDKADDYTDAVPVKDRQVIIVSEYETVKFELRLVPNREYHFVVFADFVAEGSAALPVEEQLKVNGIRHEIGETLADIAILNEAINDEVADAYFATKDIKVSNAAPQQIVLTRPYGKLRVIATDLAELNLNVNPAKVVVEYEEFNPSAFNAVTGEIDGAYAAKKFETSFVENVRDNMADHYYNVGYDAETITALNGAVRNSHITLFTDYILAEDQQAPVHFKMSVYDGANAMIKETEFATDIPVQRNFLTTVIGNVLTTATDIEVRIDDNFAGYHYFNLWDGKTAYEPKKVDGVYEIYEAAELVWMADQVNGVTRADKPVGVFANETFCLKKDIHLNGERWTPIGANGNWFAGTFDGNGHKIEGLFVYETGKASAGLFATSRGLIKDLTVLNAEVYGNYKAAVIVADGLCSRVENCTVDGAVVLSTPYNNDDANNVGAIVGYLSGEPTAYVKNCVVKNAEITAYRKVGGVVGVANRAAEVTGNTVSSSVVTADMTAEYSEVKPADVGAVVGYIASTAKVENNTPVSGPNVANQNAVKVFVKVKDGNDINQNSDFAVVIPEGKYNFTEDVKSQSIQVREGEVEITAGNVETGNANQYGFVAEGEDTSLTINAADINSLGGGIGAADGAQVTFNDGKLAVNSASTSARYLIYAVGEGTIVTVNGGEFSFSSSLNQKRAYVYCAAGAKVIINGGTFGPASKRSGYTDGIMGDGETIIYGGTFGFNPTKWVAPTSKVEYDGTNWVVTPIKAATTPEEAKEAIKNVENGGTVVLGAGTYTLSTEAKGKEFTIVGNEDVVINAAAGTSQALSGSKITFEGVTINGQASGNYAGFAHTGDLVFNNCKFVNKVTLYSKAVFNNCVLTNLKDYSIWTWGSADVEFNGCTFNSGGKALLVYGSGSGSNATPAHVSVKVANCVFNDDDTLSTVKAAIETGNDYGTTYDIEITNATVNGFAINDEGINTGTTLWGNKTSMGTDKLNVVVDGVDVY